MEKKFQLTTETKVFDGVTLYRIQALRDFSNVKKGDLGGWVETEYNLSHNGNAWVFGDAMGFWRCYGFWKCLGFWKC